MTTSLSSAPRFRCFGDRSIDELDILDIDTLLLPRELLLRGCLDEPLSVVDDCCLDPEFCFSDAHNHT